MYERKEGDYVGACGNCIFREDGCIANLSLDCPHHAPSEEHPRAPNTQARSIRVTITGPDGRATVRT